MSTAHEPDNWNGIQAIPGILIYVVIVERVKGPRRCQRVALVFDGVLSGERVEGRKEKDFS